MGFDNECIVNIQSLAGEYFCPVCRTLVYPNEALQSQCTHLYCKLCLTYVVGTTKACPYDGYLVTEKDSKPLVESDKALAERIGKTLVHCLFYRSGCLWLGPLSECTSHCSGCFFGNYPVVCNRCGVQIIHRQVQEHAQNCAGANPHVQQTAENSKDVATAVAVTSANSSQASSQPVVHTSQALVPQITTAPLTTQDSNPHVQAIVSSSGMTAEQWQQFQQYPGYDPYQQYYPYQQPAQQVLQHAPYAGQTQVYAQHLTAMQGHHQPVPQVQGQGPAQAQPQPQGQPQAQSFVQNQVNPQQQFHIQVHTQTAAQGQIPPQQPYPQAEPHPLPYAMQPPAQKNLQAPYQQALFQPQPPSQGNQAQLQIPQPHLNPQSVLQSQPQSHPYPHPLQPNNPPSQQPSPSVVQSPHIRPPQTNASLPNLQQPNQMPSQSQIQGVPPAQHAQIYPQTPQQGYIGHQRPARQPMQQYGQQPFPSQASGSVPFGLEPMQTQSQPHGSSQSQQSAVAHPPPPPHGSVQAHGMPPQQPPYHGGRPVAPNQTAASQTFPQSGGAFGGAAHSRPSGHQIFEGGIGNQQQVPSGQQYSQSDRALNKTAGNNVGGSGEDSVRVKVLDSEIRGKSGDEEHNITSEGENNATHKGTRSKVAEAEVYALRAGSSEPSMKNIVKEETATLNEIDGSVYAAKQAENSSVKDSTWRQTEAYVGHKKDDINVLALENKSSHEQVSPQGPAVGEYTGFQDKGLPNSSNPAPLTNQGRYQMPSGPFGPSSQQQRRAMPSNSQSGSYQGALPNAPPVQGPAHLKPQGPRLSGQFHQSLHSSEHFHQSSSFHTHESFEGVQRGQYFQNNPPFQPSFSKTIKAEPTGPLHGSDGAGLLQSQRLHHLEGRNPDPHVSGSFEAASGMHVKNVNDDHRNQFMTGPAGRNGHGMYEQTLKQFSKPSLINFGNGSFGAGETPSKFLPSYHPSGTFVGERPSGIQPDFHGSGPGFSVDHLPPRSPGREFHGIPSRGFGGQSGGPDMAGHDFIPNHLRRGDVFGPRNVPSHFRAVDGFGTFSDPRTGGLNGHGGFPYAELFVGNKSNHPRLGEPGFRSSFSLHEFPSSGGFYAGNLESIDRFRNRMPNSMGWCRICKVNCDSVDGLDLHSQTTEHQQRTMYMVISIKQNAKRQKTSKDHSFIEEGIRSRNAGKKRRGNKA